MAKKDKTGSVHIFSTTATPPGGLMAALKHDLEDGDRVFVAPRQMGPGLTRDERKMTVEQVRERDESSSKKP